MARPGPWWSRNGTIEIDLVGVRKGRCVLLGSCKRCKTADLDVLTDLLDQQQALGPLATHARLAVFAREGFTERLRRRAAELEALLITAGDLFA